MRALLLGILVCISAGFASAQNNIRQIDFKNFTYPLSAPLLGHAELKWLGNPKDGYSKRKPIRLINGVDTTGFTLQSVEYADVAGKGKEDAIVVLRYEAGGTQNTHYVYIYSFDGGKPKLLAYCHTGDRALYGLSKVYVEDGQLVFELLDPRERTGDCCSTWLVLMRFRWNGSRFEKSGRLEDSVLRGEAVGRPEYDSVH